MVEFVRGPARAHIGADWLFIALILIFAAIVRIAFFSRGLGTDEIVYISQAYHLLNGELNPAGYLGAIRYGINGFQALSIRLFGNGLAGACGLFFACSLANILLAYCFAYHLWGRRAAVWAGLALAVVPIDVNLAGSLNPDPYLALFIAGSIVTYYFAEQNNSGGLYILSGFLAGWVFWIKEEVLVFGLIFLVLSEFERPWRRRRLWFFFGGLVCITADLAFFWAAHGNPFYQYSVVHKDVGNWLATQPVDGSAPWAYLRYLFVNVYHTGLLGWLALAGILFALRRRNIPGFWFVLTWSAGLMLIFSLLPVSLSPLEFIRKQPNYIEIFLMPLTLLAGWFLAQQRKGVALFLGGAMVVSGVLLSALEQQVVRMVTVNGRSATEFAEAHAGTQVFGPLTAQRQSAVERLLRGSLDSSRDIRPWADLSRLPPIEGPSSDIIAYVIEDPQMRNWPDATREEPLAERLRRCLVPVGSLDREDLGLGRLVVAALRSVIPILPASFEAAALKATDPLWQVAAAQVYAVTRECARDARSHSASRPSLGVT